MLHIVTYFDHLAHDLMSRIELPMSGQSGRGNAKISICKNEMEITATDACQTIAYAYPTCRGKRLSW
jgi:hypothetical protein